MTNMTKKTKKSDDNKNYEDKYNEILVELNTVKNEITLLRDNAIKTFNDVINSKYNRIISFMELLEKQFITLRNIWLFIAFITIVSLILQYYK
jgi:hypothetical protein